MVINAAGRDRIKLNLFFFERKCIHENWFLIDYKLGHELRFTNVFLSGHHNQLKFLKPNAGYRLQSINSIININVKYTSPCQSSKQSFIAKFQSLHHPPQWASWVKCVVWDVNNWKVLISVWVMKLRISGIIF